MIDNSHRRFMQEVVALARRHNMGSVTVQFRLSVRACVGQPASHTGIVQGTWSEGRHGVPSEMVLRFEEVVSLKELSEHEQPDAV